MKSKVLIPLSLCALLAGVLVAIPSTALADRDYNHSGSRHIQKYENYNHHGDHYSHYNRWESRRAYHHAQERIYIRSHRYGHRSPYYHRSYRSYADPYVRFSPGIGIWFRLN